MKNKTVYGIVFLITASCTRSFAMQEFGEFLYRPEFQQQRLAIVRGMFAGMATALKTFSVAADPMAAGLSDKKKLFWYIINSGANYYLCMEHGRHAVGVANLGRRAIDYLLH